jgi:O-antigen/teichoic acid export membrane protein
MQHSETLGAAPALPRPAAGGGSGARLLAHLRTPLHRDGYALVLNSAFTAVTGLVYWIVAANAYTPHAVGVNAALISSMMFLAGLASLNLPNFLVRFLPGAGERTGSMVLRSYAATAAVAALAAIAFLAGIEAWAPRLRFLHDAPGMQAWFVLATMGWCVFTIQDGALTALGRAVWVPAENAVFSLVKLALVALLAAALPLYGVFVSWTAAMLTVVVGMNLLLFRRLMRGRKGAAAPVAETHAPGSLRGYFVADYAGGMAWLASINLLPLLVTSAAGATANAYFALAWAVAFPLYAVAANVGTSLTLHGSSDRGAMPTLVRKAVRQSLWLLVPAVVVLVVGAPWALSLFGGEYAGRGTTLLRLLALGALPNIVLAFTVAVARVERRLRLAVVALFAQAALSLGAVVPLVHAFGVTGAGVAWLGSQCIVAAGLLVLAAVHRQRANVADVVAGARGRRRRSAPLARRLTAAFTSDGLPASTRPVRTDSDVVVFLGTDAPLAVKIACSPAGAQALAAQGEALAAVRGLPGLNGFRELVPAVAGHGTVRGRSYLVEGAVPGTDGRAFVASGARAQALTSTAIGMAPLYEATAAPATVDEACLARLVDGHLARLSAAHRADVSEQLAALRRGIRSGLAGRDVLLARVHGDLWLGNVLLARRGARLTGVVDWEASRPDDLPAVDIAHLLLTARCEGEGRELAEVVAGLLDGARSLEAWELALLAPYLRDPIEPRTLVLLAWLQHVSQRLAQGTLHHRGRWMRRNVDPVLARFGQ